MRILQTPSSGSESLTLELFSLTQEEKGTRKTERIRVKLLVFSPGLFLRKQFVGTHVGLRITIRDNSIHKGLRTRIVLAQGISS